MFLKHEFGDSINIIILDEPTKGPADTVYQILKKANIRNTQILIKDCDSFFDHNIIKGNYVCVSRISDHSVLKKISSKSFVIANDQHIITDIIEKQVVSNTFCVGGYSFENSDNYIEAYEELQTQNEVFVSDVISRCIFNGHIFSENFIRNYTDVGTSSDWFEYNDKPVIFCDIDGTIIVSQTRVGKNNFQSEPIALQNNVNRLLELQNSGAQFIFTTARQIGYEKVTRELLNKLGFINYQLIMNLLNSKRIIINDYNKSNPFPRAIAINVPRNKDELSDYL